MQSKGWGLSRARERAVVAPFYVFSHLRKARSYRAPHFCTYVYYIYMHTRRACIYFLFRRWQERSRNLFALLKNSIKCHAHTHTTHSHPPTYPTGLSYLYTRAAREGRSRRVSAPSGGERETHTRAKSMLPSFAQTHTTQGSWFLAKMAWQGQLTLSMPFSLLNSLGGDLTNTTKQKAHHKAQFLSDMNLVLIFLIICIFN